MPRVSRLLQLQVSSRKLLADCFIGKLGGHSNRQLALDEDAVLARWHAVAFFLNEIRFISLIGKFVFAARTSPILPANFTNCGEIFEEVTLAVRSLPPRAITSSEFSVPSVSREYQALPTAKPFFKNTSFPLCCCPLSTSLV